MTGPSLRLALIGYGEVGQIFARDFAAAGVAEIAVYDITFADPASLQTHTAQTARITVARSAAEAVRESDLVISAVTAAAALDAARSVVGSLKPGSFFLDLNSVSPATKQAAADLIEAAGGRYVEAAVMSSVPPRGIRSPMLLGGPHAAALMALLEPFDLDLTDYAAEIGTASAVKMCRSVLVKGTEALLLESLLAARHYGVEAAVLASLGDMLPHPDWPRQARYMIGRALQHGKRRAEEMREVAHTVEDAGVSPLLSRPIAERQDWAYRTAAGLPAEAFKASALADLLDTILDAPAPSKTG